MINILVRANGLSTFPNPMWTFLRAQVNIDIGGPSLDLRSTLGQLIKTLISEGRSKFRTCCTSDLLETSPTVKA